MYDLLKGMRIVEAAAFVAGPCCGLHLAQLGAEVIRIDQVGGGPDFHRWPRSPDDGASLYWEGLNKSKKSVALDLSRPEGRELAMRIATAPGENAGLFITNYPVNGFLSYERLRERRENLICVRVMGWPDGRPGLDYTINAAVGLPYMTGPSDDARPVNHVLPAWDLLTGAYAAFALMAAERDRRLTGKGREIRVPLSDVAIASVGNLGQIGEIRTTGRDRSRTGNEIFGAFGRDFLTQDGKRLMVTAITARQWKGLVQSLALEPLLAELEKELDVSFAVDEGIRFKYSARLMPLFERSIAGRRSEDLGAAFENGGVCWARYQTLKQALDEDEYFTSSNPVLTEIDHPSGHRYLAPGCAATFPQDERMAPIAAPQLGRDTEEVLAEILELPASEIARLHDAGLVKSA
jgi:2-methylfumaryl-CoA isomerase